MHATWVAEPPDYLFMRATWVAEPPDYLFSNAERASVRGAEERVGYGLRPYGIVLGYDARWAACRGQRHGLPR